MDSKDCKLESELEVPEIPAREHISSDPQAVLEGKGKKPTNILKSIYIFFSLKCFHPMSRCALSGFKAQRGGDPPDATWRVVRLC